MIDQDVTVICDGTAALCEHGRYIYYDRVQGVYVHEDDGSMCAPDFGLISVENYSTTACRKDAEAWEVLGEFRVEMKRDDT